MDRNTADLGWSDEQWSRASKIVQQEAQRARVAGQFLPTYAQPDATAVAVPKRVLSYDDGRIGIDNSPTIALTSLAVNIYLTSQEAGDPEQSAALIELRRAANIIARLEDALVFRGMGDKKLEGVGNVPEVYTATGGDKQPGLIGGKALDDQPVLDYKPAGEDVAGKIIEAIGKLEAAGHNRPFACVLGHRLYTALHTPTNAMILPRDRVVPFLEGPLLRSSTLTEDAGQGMVIALGGSPIELVVSSELHLRFLQITPEPNFVLRLSERVALRVTDWSAIAVLTTKPKA